jgi:hypothetical protein
MLLHQSILTTSLQSTPLKIITEYLATSAVASSLLIKSINTRASVRKRTPKNVRSLTLKLLEKLPMLLVKELRKTLTLLHHASKCRETRNLQPKQLLLVAKSLARFPSGSYRVCNLDKL